MASPTLEAAMQIRYAIRWSRLPETVALAASAVGLLLVIAGLL